MITVKSKNFLEYASRRNERSKVEAELWVDNAAELPAIDGIEGYTLAQGSIAYVIQTGAIYVMDSEGTWYKSGGESS